MTAANHDRRGLTPFQAAVFDGYAVGDRPAVIAARWGTKPQTVRTTATWLRSKGYDVPHQRGCPGGGPWRAPATRSRAAAIMPAAPAPAAGPADPPPAPKAPARFTAEWVKPGGGRMTVTSDTREAAERFLAGMLEGLAAPGPPPAWLAQIPALQARCRYGRFG